MSFAKAEQLLKLADLASSSRRGISLEDIEAQFSVSHRTAQRLVRTLELQFPDVETLTDGYGRKRWRIKNNNLRDQLSISAEELAAVQLGVETLRQSNADTEADLLSGLREKIVSLLPRSYTRLAPDYAALSEAQGLVARPGPKPIVDKDIHGVLVDAIKACRIVAIRYRSNHNTSHRTRRVAPLGFLYGIRRYLVAEDAADDRGPTVKTYRLDHVKSVQVFEKYFTRPEGFDLQAFANTSFGVFQRTDNVADIVWRFKPEAADNAASYQFHPTQKQERLPDGSLIVKFRAAGIMEMVWHLYSWGDKVEVLAPEELKVLVQGHQRSDFIALP